MKKIGYVGTYYENGSEGIYRFEFENGILSNPTLFSKVKNAKYIKYHQDMLISLGDFNQGSGVCLIDRSGDIIDRLIYEQKTSCYVDAKKDRIYTTNYHIGSLSEICTKKGSLKLIETIVIEDKGGCHQVLFVDDIFIVICLHKDEVRMFDEELEMIGSIHFEQGFGPRHGVLSHDKRWLYVIGELSNQLAAVDLRHSSVVKMIPVLGDDQINLKGSAAIRMSDDGKYVVVSTRDKNVLSLIAVDQENMELKQVVSTQGDHPRDILIVDGYILVANRKSNQLLSFKFENGWIDPNPVSMIKIIEGVSIAMEE
ncbi:MAG: beta-propeller fold lactonase family protein [Erysipelotrichaceae bacterium]|nr:beta-propeller fold lactonase family protein [Erysipelotrichaceae bacterium]MDD3924716.1 beta-propeller fold lactonase family protein [Erysipelotrichaceae bacterium]